MPLHLSEESVEFPATTFIAFQSRVRQSEERIVAVRKDLPRDGDSDG
jgi:hypothetical protein